MAIVEDLCPVMDRALFNLVVTLDLQRISLGGSVFWHHRELLLPRLGAHLAGKLPVLTEGCDPVAPAWPTASAITPPSPCWTELRIKVASSARRVGVSCYQTRSNR